MIKQLIKLATHLDSKGHSKEADYLDAMIRKVAADDDESEFDSKQFMEDTKEQRDQSADDILKWLSGEFAKREEKGSATDSFHDIMDRPNPGLTLEDPNFNPAGTATEEALQLDFLSDGILTGDELIEMGKEMQQSGGANQGMTAEEAIALEKWQNVLEKIEKRLKEIEGKEYVESNGSVSMSMVPLYLYDEEVDLRMSLKNDFGWSQDRIDEYQRKRPSWS